MKKTVGLLFFMLTSCFGQTKYGNPEVDPIAIQKNFMEWWTYQSNNIMLSSDFVALDSNSTEISKESFLKQLSDGTTIPVRLQSNDALVYYKLFKIESNADSNIKPTIASSSIEEYEHYKMEGTQFPDFNFIDLNGITSTNQTTKNKIVVLKCWYIHCAACIKEFPDVNKLAEKYSNRKDILFISLAEDSPQELKMFLAKKPLSYSVIPNMKIYMNETLHLNAFPTHFIINKEGKIAKVLMNYESLEAALEIESRKP